jgi:hypothetical protein
MIETQRHKGTEVDNALTYKIIGAAIEVHRALGGQVFLKVFMNQDYVTS